MSGYRRLGRARKRDLRARRLSLDPPLVVNYRGRRHIKRYIPHPGGQQAALREQRTAFRAERRERRARGPVPFAVLLAEYGEELDRAVLGASS